MTSRWMTSRWMTSFFCLKLLFFIVIILWEVDFMENKLLPDENEFQNWAEVFFEYDDSFWRQSVYEADFIPKELKKIDHNDKQKHDDYFIQVIKLMFNNLDKEMTMYALDENRKTSKYCGSCYSILVNRYNNIQSNHWVSFPNWHIFKVVLGFIFVISWVGIGYFMVAIQKQKPKLKFFANIIAGIFDTAACGFIVYSLIASASLFSVPVIVATMVSLVLRIIFAILIGKNIFKNKQSINYNNTMFYPMFRKIGDYLTRNKSLMQKQNSKEAGDKENRIETLNKKGEEINTK